MPSIDSISFNAIGVPHTIARCRGAVARPYPAFPVGARVHAAGSDGTSTGEILQVISASRGAFDHRSATRLPATQSDHCARGRLHGIAERQNWTPSGTDWGL